MALAAHAQAVIKFILDCVALNVIIKKVKSFDFSLYCSIFKYAKL